MNIFVTDRDPFIAAQNLCDAHVVKMILESCQLLSTQDRLHGLTEDRYKMTHVNHPCRLCLCNPFNRAWLKFHLMGLLNEYTFRFNKVHKCREMFDSLWRYNIDYVPAIIPAADTTEVECFIRELSFWTIFPQCMPDEYKVNSVIASRESGHIEDTIEAYRRYYKHKKGTLKRFKYTEREPPDWL